MRIFIIGVLALVFLSSCSNLLSVNGRENLIEMDASKKRSLVADFTVHSKGRTKHQSLYFWLDFGEKTSGEKPLNLDAKIMLTSLSGNPISVVKNSGNSERGVTVDLQPGKSLLVFNGQLRKSPSSFYMPLALNGIGNKGTLLRAKLELSKPLPNGARLRVASLWADGP